MGDVFNSFGSFPNLQRINLENIIYLGYMETRMELFADCDNLRYVRFHPEAQLPSHAFSRSGLVEVVVPGSEFITYADLQNRTHQRERSDARDEGIWLYDTFSDCPNLNKVIFPLDFDPNAGFDNTFDNCPQLRDVVMPLSLFEKLDGRYLMLLGENDTNIENITFSSHPFTVRNLDGVPIPVEIKWPGGGFNDNELISVYEIYNRGISVTPEEEDEYIEYFNRLVNIGCKTINEYIVDQYPDQGPPESFIVRGRVKLHDPVGDVYREAGRQRGTDYWGYWSDPNPSGNGYTP